jgi:hypothetical protein
MHFIIYDKDGLTRGVHRFMTPRQNGDREKEQIGLGKFSGSIESLSEPKGYLVGKPAIGLAAQFGGNIYCSPEGPFPESAQNPGW